MPLIQTDSQHYTDIANAIRTKNNLLTQYYPEDMAGAIIALPEAINVYDICNHGEYSGSSNPYYNTTTFYNVSSGNVNYSRWNITNSGIIRGNSGWDWSRGTLTMPIDKRKYSKVCCKAVIDNRTSTSYSNYEFRIGVFKKSRGHTYDGYDKDVVICYRNTNYAGTTPSYIMPETEIKLDVSTLDEDYYYIRFVSCDVQCRLTELWLEP